MASWSSLDAELADTLEAVRGGRPLPTPADERRLARDLVGAAKPPTVGVCSYCGAVAPLATVCDAHSDLTDLDPGTSAVVATSTQTNGGGRTSLDGTSAATPSGGAF